MNKNLFDDLPTSASNELIDILVSSDGVRVERIVSTGHASATDDWYDQSQNEWVVVLHGGAQLEFWDANGHRRIESLEVGDHMLIPAHQKHRVHWTSPAEPTVWLAVFF